MTTCKISSGEANNGSPNDYRLKPKERSFGKVKSNNSSVDFNTPSRWRVEILLRGEN